MWQTCFKGCPDCQDVSDWPGLGRSAGLLQHFGAGNRQKRVRPLLETRLPSLILLNLLIKKLQVLDGNRLFKHSKKERRPPLIQPHTTRCLRVNKGTKPRVFSLSHKCQTHSLSMVKQVTGPSALQVAVLKTSLHNQKFKKKEHYTCETREYRSVNACARRTEIWRAEICGSCRDLSDEITAGRSGDSKRLTVFSETVKCLHGCKRICCCCVFQERHGSGGSAQPPGSCLQASVLLPWLPYKGLLPEMFPFSHPADLLLLPVHILSHQNLKKNAER